MAIVSSGKGAAAASGAAKAAYAAPKLTAYGNVSELTGGPSRGTPDGRSAGAGNNSMM